MSTIKSSTKYTWKGGRSFGSTEDPWHINYSELGAPPFAQLSSKTSWLLFLSDFRNINKQLKIKPYKMPKINALLLK